MKNIRENEKRAGRLVLAGFDGTVLPPEIRKKIETDALLGIILFKRNVESHLQAAALNEAARRAAPRGRPPVVAVDQEGGRVIRLREPLTVLPPARAFGILDDEAVTRKAGELIARELSAVGFTLNFAPVMDIDTHPASPVIGDRSYGPTPASVIRHGLAFAQGMSVGGVIPCAKHFPGHGDAAVDSHLALPNVSHSLDRLRTVETVPFEAWIAAELGPVMTAHVMYPAFDEEFPATLSRIIVEQTLRGTLGYTGPVLTDDMEMGALAAYGGPGGAAVRAVKAGADGLLVCRHFSHIEAVIDALAREATDTPGFRDRLDEADLRLTALRRLPAGNPSFLSSEAHLAMVHEVTAAITGVTD